jgi:ABC-type Fe3+/spermidine/putrescine transport system ATPase subunit
VHAVVRPEKLELREAGEPAHAGGPSVEGQIESTLYLGTATQVVVRLKDGTAMTVLVPNSDDAERQRLPGAGADVRLTWADEHIHMVREPEGGDPQ